MLTLALAIYPQTLLILCIVLSRLVGAQLLSHISSIMYVPLGSSVGLLGPPLLRFTTIVLTVGCGISWSSLFGGEDELFVSDPVNSSLIELELGDDVYKLGEAVIVPQDMKFAKLTEGTQKE